MEATYKNQDGLVRVQKIKPLFKILGFRVWRVKVIAIIKQASFGGNPKIGAIEQISERWFV